MESGLNKLLFYKWSGVNFLLFFLLGLVGSLSQCPSYCECKWKSGKESVICSAAAKLTQIPTGLDPGTQVLDLSGNLIERLPNGVFKSLHLLNLQKIFLSSSALSFIESRAFEKLSNLMELDLTGNSLPSVPSPSFDSIGELRELKLSGNPITHLLNNAFLPLSRLVRLELTGCKIRVIQLHAFRGLTSLEWLKINSNKLLTVQADSFVPLKSLHGLSIHDNPWNCSCELKNWREWMRESRIPYSVPPLCSFPPRLRGRNWEKVSEADFACLPTLLVNLDSRHQSARSERVSEGENATFTCQLSATPDTHVEWYSGSRGILNGTSFGSSSSFLITSSYVPLSEINSNSESNTINKYLDSTTSSNGIKIAKLSILRTTLRDSGIYTCQAQNAAGSVSMNFSLTVIQIKAEQLSGHLLFTGALVAALFMILMLLLLSCLIFATRLTQNPRNQNPPTGNGVILNDDKIELHSISAQRNKRNSIESNDNNTHSSINSSLKPNSTTTSNGLIHHDNANHNHTPGANITNIGVEHPNINHVNNIKSPVDFNQSSAHLSFGALLASNNKNNILQPSPSSSVPYSQSQSINNSSSAQNNENDDLCKKLKTCRNLSNNYVSVPTSADPESDDENSSLINTANKLKNDENWNFNNGTISRPLSFKNQLQEHRNSVPTSTKVVINLKKTHEQLGPQLIRNGSYTKSEVGNNYSPNHHQYPDLINQKPFDFTASLPRGNLRGKDYTKRSTFHLRNNSESTSPLLSSSSGLSFENIGENLGHRVSMPTSPTSSYALCSHDAHAAQLSAFLAEYKALQEELLRMSGDLNNSGEIQLNSQNNSHHYSSYSRSNSLTNGAHPGTHLENLGGERQELRSILKNNTNSSCNSNKSHNNYVL